MITRVRRSSRRQSIAIVAVRAALAGGATFAAGPALAQTYEPAPATVERYGRLVLGDVYAAAQQANPRAAAARALAQAARARIPSAKRPADPQVQLGFMNYELPGLSPMDPIGMTQLQVMQMVPIGGKLGLSGDVAEARAGAEAARAREVAWDTRTRVAEAFYELYALDRSLVVARETLRLLHDVARTTESMYRVGEGRQADVLRSQVEIARMTEDTLRMRAMRTAVAGRLNALLDRSAEAEVGIPQLPVFPSTTPLLDSLQRAAGGRPMIHAGSEEVQAAVAASRLARRELLPDVQLGVQYGQRRGAMGTERMGSLMVGASVPVFARSRQLRMRDEMAAMRDMAEADLASMRADTRAAVAEAYADLTRARNLTALYRGTVIPQTEATVSSALAAYRVGGVDFMALLDDRMLVNEYRQELFRLEAEEGKAWAELEMLLGRELLDSHAVARGAAEGSVR